MKKVFIKLDPIAEQYVSNLEAEVERLKGQRDGLLSKMKEIRDHKTTAYHARRIALEAIKAAESDRALATQDGTTG